MAVFGRRFGVAVAAAVSVLAGFLPASGFAQNRTTLLIMAEDGDADSLARNNRITRRVIDALMEQMNQTGFDVFDETAVTMDTTDTKRIRRPDAELIDTAKNNARFPGQPNRPLTIRAVATVEIFASVEKKSYTNVARVRVTGRMLDVQSGRFLGNYEMTDPAGQIRLPPSCENKECLLESIGDNAKDLGQAVGHELARLLQFDRGGPGVAAGSGGGRPVPAAHSGAKQPVAGEEIYSLRFENLTDKEMAQLEVYLVDYFSGYRNHNADKNVGMTHTYTYWSTISGAKLQRNLVRSLDELGWEGTVTNAANSYTVRKLALRGIAKAKSDPAGW